MYCARSTDGLRHDPHITQTLGPTPSCFATRVHLLWAHSRDLPSAACLLDVPDASTAPTSSRIGEIARPASSLLGRTVRSVRLFSMLRVQPPHVGIERIGVAVQIFTHVPDEGGKTETGVPRAVGSRARADEGVVPSAICSLTEVQEEVRYDD